VQPEDEWQERRHLGPGYTYASQPLLASTTRPDLIVGALEARAREGSLGVTQDFTAHWIAMIMQRDHRELLNATAERPDVAARVRRLAELYRPAAEHVV